jgi:hypothetical protein
MSETRKLAAIRSQISLAIAGLVARLEGIAKPGAIYLSEDAYRQVKQRLDLKVADFGAVQLKNVADGPRLFARSRQAGRTELAPTFAAIGTAVTAARSRKGRSRTLLPSAWPAALVAALSAVGWFVGGNTRRRRLWCKCWRSAQESAREPDADHAPSTAFQISGAVLFLTRSLPSLN